MCLDAVEPWELQENHWRIRVYDCLAADIDKMERNKRYESDDSFSQMDEQAKRLPKFSNINRVPQQQV